MDIKKYSLSTLAVFFFIFIFESIVNGYLLQGIYHETASNWRTVEAMTANFHILLAFQLLIAAWITYIYTQWVTEKTIEKGLYFGLHIGVLIGLIGAMSYVWLPIPAVLALSWFITGVVEGLGIGFILGTIYKTNETRNIFKSFWK